MNMTGEILSNFYSINFTIFVNRISDHCSKPIKCPYYLFELIGKDLSDIEIFGANDTNDRQVRNKTHRFSIEY